MVDIGINAWSFLFHNLKINIILQDYLKSVWKTIKFKLIFNHLWNCSSQSEKSGQPMIEQKYSHWRKQLISKEREKEWIRTKMKRFHSGYSDQEVRIKVYPFKSSQLWWIKKILKWLPNINWFIFKIFSPITNIRLYITAMLITISHWKFKYFK